MITILIVAVTVTVRRSAILVFFIFFFPPVFFKQIETHHAGHSSGYGSSAPSAYSAPSSGWDSYGGGHDAHGSYSNNVAQSMAYGNQKPASR